MMSNLAFLFRVMWFLMLVSWIFGQLPFHPMYIVLPAFGDFVTS